MDTHVIKYGSMELGELYENYTNTKKTINDEFNNYIGYLAQFGVTEKFKIKLPVYSIWRSLASRIVGKWVLTKAMKVQLMISCGMVFFSCYESVAGIKLYKEITDLFEEHPMMTYEYLLKQMQEYAMPRVMKKYNLMLEHSNARDKLKSQVQVIRELNEEIERLGGVN